jgi:hypothetical protein
VTTDQWLTGAATALGALTSVAVAHPIFLLIFAGALYVAKTS